MRAYEALKLRILAELGEDPPAYNAAKEPFIREVLARALADRPLRGISSLATDAYIARNAGSASANASNDFTVPPRP